MVIEKDPDNLPNDVVDFIDVYGDINSPQYWIAESEDDLKSSLLVLDGHSTIIVYTKDTEELHWEAIHELGQYKYTPDSIGDGLIVFPHTFYLEFSITLTDKKLKVNANFDGTGVRAITMPFKDKGIEGFISSLTDRISDIFSSGLKANDDQLEIKTGETLQIPDSILNSTISFKLGLIGINLQKLNVMEVTEIDIPEEDIQEEVFEVPEKVDPKEEKQKEAEREKITQVTEDQKKEPAPKSKVPPARKPPGPGGTSAPSPPPAATGGGGSVPPSPTKSKSAPPSPDKTSSGAAVPPPSVKKPVPSSSGPPTPGDKGADEVEAAEKSPSSIPAPKADKSRSSAPPSPKKKRAKSSASVPPAAELEDIMDDEIGEEMEEEGESAFATGSSTETEDKGMNLYARGMDTSSSQKSKLKNAHVTWFSRMIPNRAYPLAVKITSEDVKVRKSVTNQTTGEVRSEKKDTLVVDTSDKLVIRPEFPGCLIVPSKRVFDADEDNISANFHVTPLAMGHLENKIIFEQNSEEIHSIDLETKVIKHRISQVAAGLGALTGSLPAVFAFMFDQSPGSFMNDRLENISFLAGLGYLVPLLLSGLLFTIAAGFYLVNRPSYDDKSVSFPR